MSAAILQGVPGSTLDTDFWIDLPPRQYIRVLNICHKQGATIRANMVADLSDGTIVNFIYEIHGLKKFDTELKRAKRLRWLGTKVHVLSLRQIYQSKKFVGRPKDIAQLPLLEQTMKLQRHLAQKRARD